jgi:capsular polysaccharide export protein
VTSWFFRDEQAIAFRDPMDQWPARVRGLLRELRIDAIVLFGQSRRMHQEAIQEALALGIAAFVFEEGYVRPDYVTLEVGGVNAASPMPRQPDFYREPERRAAAGAAGHGAELPCRGLGRDDLFDRPAFGHARYPHYRHHRSIAPVRQG